MENNERIQDAKRAHGFFSARQSMHQQCMKAYAVQPPASYEKQDWHEAKMRHTSGLSSTQCWATLPNGSPTKSQLCKGYVCAHHRHLAFHTECKCMNTRSQGAKQAIKQGKPAQPRSDNGVARSAVEVGSVALLARSAGSAALASRNRVVLTRQAAGSAHGVHHAGCRANGAERTGGSGHAELVRGLVLVGASNALCMHDRSRHKA